MPRSKRRPRRVARLVLFYLMLLVAVLAGSGAATVVLYGALPPLATPLMLIRGYDDGIWEARWRWVSYARISPNLVRAVIASEDGRFCQHQGFDWTEIRKAFRSWQREGDIRGASTISNQTAKNLFLWPERSFLRKGLEVYFTVLIESMWSKRRIMEVYLNIAEWGRGIYGAEAAAQVYFGRSADRLTIRQAALLAAALPDPLDRSPGRPSGYMRARASDIVRRVHMTPVGEHGPCE